MLPIDEPPLSAGLIRARHAAVSDRLRAAALAAGRDPDAFRIVAVSKGFGSGVLAAAWQAGLRAFGENRVQEALPKIAAMPDAEWHLIGHLQSNKARPALHAFRFIHAVDSLDLLQRLERIAHDDGMRPAVLLQVNLSGDPTRVGFAPADLRAAALVLAALRSLAPVGLMTMAPAGATPAGARAVFAACRELRDRLRDASGLALPELSMGMSSDAESAVAEGASLVRIGAAIFGPRPG
jgi:pyridoxal phosphate enzyme (YggS family)